MHDKRKEKPKLLLILQIVTEHLFCEIHNISCIISLLGKNAELLQFNETCMTLNTFTASLVRKLRTSKLVRCIALKNCVKEHFIRTKNFPAAKRCPMPY